MEQVLLWVSLIVGVLLFLGQFLPVGEARSYRASSGDRDTPDTPVPPPFPPLLRGIAIATPLLGFVATLPTGSLGPFHDGQKLGVGFLWGALAALGGNLCVFERRHRLTNAAAPVPSSFPLLTSSYGTAIAAISLATLFLRASLLDALMGVALGGFSVAFVLLLGLPPAERNGRAGAHLAAGTGFLATLAGGAAIAALRDAVTPDLSKMAWVSVLQCFAALGTLLAAGASLLSKTGRGGASRLMPLGVLTLIGGVILFLLTQKITDNARFFIPGMGGLLLWPVALAVMRDAHRSQAAFRPALLVAALLIAAGFLSAQQLLQGTGAAICVAALFLAHLATLNFEESQAGESGPVFSFAPTNLLVFATLLLLWRFFVARWDEEMHGMNVSDQYALFGLILGVALPRVLAVVPDRFIAHRAKFAGLGTLVFCLLLATACPTALLLLFGVKSALALIVGLVLGLLPLSDDASPFRAFFALATALFLAQFTHYLTPPQAWTRIEKMRVLLVIMAGVVVALSRPAA